MEAVLLAVGLGLDEHHFFCQTVRGVGLLGVAVPQVFLFKGDRGKLGVGTDGAHGNEFPDPEESGLFHQLRAHHEVFIKKTPRVFPVGPDSAHHRRQVDDDVGPGRFEKPDDRLFLDQVIFGALGDEDKIGPLPPHPGN